MPKTNDAPKTAYLRNRPFLVVARLARPAQSARTNMKGWMSIQANVDVQEEPIIVDRITDDHLISATVIVDLLRETVIKNRTKDDAESLLASYKAKYSNIIQQGIQASMRRNLQYA